MPCRPRNRTSPPKCPKADLNNKKQRVVYARSLFAKYLLYDNFMVTFTQPRTLAHQSNKHTTSRQHPNEPTFNTLETQRITQPIEMTQA
eukprot:6028507-Amphidinium_carterae.1